MWQAAMSPEVWTTALNMAVVLTTIMVATVYLRQWRLEVAREGSAQVEAVRYMSATIALAALAVAVPQGWWQVYYVAKLVDAPAALAFTLKYEILPALARGVFAGLMVALLRYPGRAFWGRRWWVWAAGVPLVGALMAGPLLAALIS